LALHSSFYHGCREDIDVPDDIEMILQIHRNADNKNVYNVLPILHILKYINIKSWPPV
jgi:hypothetical protein